MQDRFKPDPNDVIILCVSYSIVVVTKPSTDSVMGPTGSGKRTFIHTLTGDTERYDAGRFESDAQDIDITPYPISYQGLRVVLVDTPGFDDTYLSDAEILRVMADWLVQKYPDGSVIKITGIVYAHRITDEAMSGSAYKNLQLFGRLCGSVPLPRTRLITTMWDQSKDRDMAVRRETQLKDDFWKVLIQGGARVYRFYNTPDSAQEILGSLLRMGNVDDGEELLIQGELVEQQKRLNETEAGKFIYNRLQKLLADQRKMLKDLAKEAKQQNDPDLAKSLRAECDKVDVQLQRTLEEIKELETPFSRRILLWLFGRKSRAKAVGLDFTQT